MNACRYDMDQVISCGFQSRRPPRGHTTGLFHNDGPSRKYPRIDRHFGTGFRGGRGHGFGGDGRFRGKY